MVRPWHLGGGKIPQSGQDVYIPNGISVVYDGVSNARLDTVGVDGELHFAVAKDTKMMVDTLVTGPQSVFTVGVENNPVKQGVKAEIIIHRDNGSINRREDPTELSKGIVTHGQTSIAGQDKADFLRADTPPKKGATKLVFDEKPVGWEVGDKLVVAGTKFVADNTFQDEIVSVKSIAKVGNKWEVRLNETLQYDHTPPATETGAKLEVPVANYTRNVFIGTETDGDKYMSDGKTVPIDERGHVMFMHNDDVSVQNAEFFELGRTDKSQLTSDDNPQGRYALHFHRTGVEDYDNPALAEGNAVWGSPGWGIVPHDSNLDVISNAVFGVNGGAIIAEAGNETGEWSNNITIQTTGDFYHFNSEDNGKVGHPAGRAQYLNDGFHQGIGFGFKSRMIETTDNVAVSSNGAGYSYFPMGTEGPSHIDALAENYENLHGYNPFYEQTDERPSVIPNRVFTNNEAMVGHVGFNTSADKRPSETDASSIIEGFTAWEIVQGFGGFYQRDYLVKDSVFIGLQDGFGSHVKSPAGEGTVGVMSREFHELKLVNNQFENFDIGIWENSHDDVEYIHVILGNEFIDVDRAPGP